MVRSDKTQEQFEARPFVRDTPAPTIVANPSIARIVAVGLSGLFLVFFGADMSALVVAGGLLVWWMSTSPAALLGTYAAIICSNAGEIATNRYGLPPIGMATLLVLTLMLVVRTAGKQEDISNAVRLAPAAAIYLVIASLSLFWVKDLDATTDKLFALTKNLLIGLIFVAYVTSMRRFRTIAYTISLTVAVLAALGVFQYVTKTFELSYFGFATASIKQLVGETDTWRISGPFDDANFFGQILIVGLPITGAIAVAAERPALKLAAAVGCVVILAAIGLTFSRGTLLSALIVAAAFGLTLRHRVVYASLIALVLVMAMVATPALYLERLLQVGQAISAILAGEQWITDPSLALRLSVLSAATDMFWAHPWFGIGLGQFPLQYGEYALQNGLYLDAPNKPHSVYLGTLAEGGVLGFAMLVGVIGFAFATCAVSRRQLINHGRSQDAIFLFGLQLAFIGYMTTALFLHDDYARNFWLLAALLFSTAFAARNPLETTASTSQLTRRKYLNANWSSPTAIRTALWNQRYLIALFTLIGLVAGWVQFSQTQQRYKAETTLLYRFGREYFPLEPGEARRNWGENVHVSLDAAVSTEMHLLNSYALYARSLEAAGPDTTIVDTETLSAQIKAVSAAFQIRRVQGAAMVTISTHDRSAARADQLLKAQVQGYLDLRRRIFEADAVAFYDAKIAAALKEQADLLAQNAALRQTARPDTVSGALANLRIDAQIETVKENLKRLRQERGDAALSQSYREEVAKVIETVDWRSAEGNPVLGLGPSTKLLLSTLLGFVLGVVLVLAMAATHARTPKDQ